MAGVFSCELVVGMRHGASVTKYVFTPNTHNTLIHTSKNCRDTRFYVSTPSTPIHSTTHLEKHAFYWYNIRNIKNNMEENQNPNTGVMPVMPGAPSMPEATAAPAQTNDTSAPQPMQAPAPSTSITLDQLVSLAIEQEASDIHFTEGGRVALRVHGKFVFIENITELAKADAEKMIQQMLVDETEAKRLETVREVDFSYIHSTGVSFRVNAFYTRGRLSASMRMISKHLPSMEELGIPEVMKQFLGLREGLILVTGTNGSGKSTSIQAMLENVNQNEVKHIITIENPIEHIFKEEKSIFSQRELGKDTMSFSNAIHSATREDPNIVMVSEIVDKDAFDAVLSLVEMGHLVIASMSTRNVMQTIEHIISMYPHQEQEIMQDRFAENLAVIMSQDLLDRIDQSGRVALFEILIANNGVKNIIKRGSLAQLRTAMESEGAQGMVTMDNYAIHLAERGIIAKEAVNRYINPVE